MTRSTLSLLLVPGLFLLLIGCAAAGPDLRPRAERSSACQEHSSLHSRLDVIEKKVEESVDKLEEELVSLLDKIEDSKWSPLVDSTAHNTVDILEDPRPRTQQ